MSITLGANQYGKAECRLLTVSRDGPVHHVKDLNVGIALRGDFAACHRTGDNARILPTDTQKNTVYAFAKESGVGEIEDFALLLARHFAGHSPHVHAAQVRVEEYGWRRAVTGGAAGGEPVPHPHTFVRDGGETRFAQVTADDRGVEVISGLTGLVVLKSTGSEFRGFAVDPYTTLPETGDRILATAVTAQWRHARPSAPDEPGGTDEAGGTDGAGGDAGGTDWAESFAAARAALIETFAVNHSRSLQQTLYDMGEQVLERRPEIAEIRMSMPNRHHFAVDLEPFGLDNAGEVFFPADRPYGLIEGAVTRDGAADPGTAWSWGFSWNFSSR